jgi:hypothetical protein
MVIEPVLGAIYCGPRARLELFFPGIVTVSANFMVGPAEAPGELVGGLVGEPLAAEDPGATLLPPPPPQAVTSATIAVASTKRSCFLITRASAP